MSVVAHSRVLTLVVIRAVSAFTRHDESRRALTREASLVISTSASLAIAQQAFVDILASVSLLRESIVTVALVSVLGVYALPVSAYVRPQRALVYLGDRLQLLQAKPVVIVTSGIRADVTLVTPSTSHVLPAAAIFLAQPHCQTIFALAVPVHRRVTEALPSIYAESSILALDESRIAKAVVAAVRVYASAVGADPFLLALVFVLARVGFGIPGLAVGTLAGE